MKRNEIVWLNRISLGCLIVLAPLMLFPRGILPFLSVGLAGCLLLVRWRVYGRPRLQIMDIPLIFMTVMALIGLSISFEPALSWPRWWALLFGLLVYVILRSSLKLDKDSTWAATGLILLGFGLAGASLVGTDWSNVRYINLSWLYERLPTLIHSLPGSGVSQTSDLFNPRWVGITMGILAPVYLPLIAWRKHTWLQVLAALAFVIVTGTLFLTQAFQGLLGLAVGSFIVLLFISRWFWLLLPIGGLLIAAVVWHLGPMEVWTALLSLDNPVGKAVVLRLDIWTQAWAMLKDMPYTGIGLNTFPLAQSEFYTGYLIGPEPHAHNLFLQTALDLGLPGLVAFFWLISAWSKQVLHQLSHNSTQGSRLLLIGVLAGVGSYLAHGLIDAMMLGAKPSFVVWALLGIGAATPHIEILPEQNRGVKYWLGWMALPILALMIALIFSVSVPMNIGALQAQHILHPFPDGLGTTTGSPETARLYLTKAIELNPAQSQAHFLLARLASATGDFATAETHYQARVALDMQNPIYRYNLTQGLLQGSLPATQLDHAKELLKIYQAWNGRFPERAEVYLLKSIVFRNYLGDESGADNLLQAGIQANARPVGLLSEALNK